MKKIKLTAALAFALVINIGVHAQKNMYPEIAEDYFILQGDKCSWDADAVHTFSVVEANRDGYKYWGYYGLDKYEKDEHARKGGLVRSNDLINWTKYEYNPVILSNCRWPTVVISNGIFYMYYAEYNKPNDSRIVMMESKNGIDFENKIEIVPYASGQQNQNPFIYFNANDSMFYLFYYNGTERAKVNPYWSVRVKKSKNIKDLAAQQSYEVIKSNKTLAAPSVAYYNNTYYLLVEEFTPERDRWLTNAFQSDNVDKGYKRVANNPVLSNNDACAFQYVLNNKLYVSYSHCIDLKESIWNLRMIKLK
ncbi:MAG: hypothetical protein ABI091_09780 [Ferruginibacter sp.]